MQLSQIWSLDSDVNSVTLDELWGGFLCADYFTGADRHHLFTGSKDGTAQVSHL